MPERSEQHHLLTTFHFYLCARSLRTISLRTSFDDRHRVSNNMSVQSLVILIRPSQMVF